MDIRLFAARAGIFFAVYIFVLSAPFALGYKYGKWELATLAMLFFASAGYFIFIYLARQAEYCLFFEERKSRQFIVRALDRLMRKRSINKLASYMVHLVALAFKTDNSAIFFLDEESGIYKLETVRLKSGCRYAQSLSQDDPLIAGLSCHSQPRVYEQAALEARKQKGKAVEVVAAMESLSIAVITPICLKRKILGILMLGKKKSGRPYFPEDLSALWALSHQAALAVENTRFYEKAQENLLNEDWSFIGHGASHQFGNVLNRIIQRSSGKEADIEDMDVHSASYDELKKLILELKEDLQAITHAGLQGKEIVSGILSLGSRPSFDLAREDLRGIILKSVQSAKLKQSKASIGQAGLGLEISVDILDDLPKILCNSLQIEQVLDNILDNALEAIEEKDALIKCGELNYNNVFYGNILIKGWASGPRVFLEITDNGIGIGPQEQKKMFTPFFTTKKAGRFSRKGHGIGMHMVKEIIKAHQGKIYIVQSAYGQGTTFRIELPV